MHRKILKRVRKYAIESIIRGLPLIVFVVLLFGVSASLVPQVAVHLNTSLCRVIVFTVVALKSLWIAIMIAMVSFNSKAVRIMWLMSVIVIFDVYVVLGLRFSVGFTPYVGMLIMQSNPQEACEFFSAFFNYRVIVFMTGAPILILLAYMMLSRFLAPKAPILIANCDRKFKAFVSVLIVALVISAYIDFFPPEKINNMRKPGDDLSTYSIAAILFSSQPPVEEIFAAFDHGQCNKNIIDAIDRGYKECNIKSCEYSVPNIVLIVGESHIKSHSSLYGYRLETNPYLTAEYKRGNLYVFTDVVSKYEKTKDCLFSLFSTKNVDIDDISQSNCLWPSIFKKAGYRVLVFDNQASSVFYESEYAVLFLMDRPEIRDYCLDYRNRNRYVYDHEMVDAECAVKLNISAPYNLIILHLMGQHIDAASRYPHTTQFDYFTEDSIRRTSQYCREIAVYDNATRYNDYVINKVIDLFRDKEALVIYTSDHGDSVCDDEAETFGRPMTTNLTDAQIKLFYEVPFFIWCSDSYKEKHPETCKRIEAAVDRPFQNDDISHMLFDLAGIDCDEYIPRYSLISPEYEPHMRSLYKQDAIYDYDSRRESISNVVLMNTQN